MSNFGQILTLKWPPNTQKLEFLKNSKRSRKLPSMMTIHYHKHDCTCFHKKFPGANAQTYAQTQSDWIRLVFLQKPNLIKFEVAYLTLVWLVSCMVPIHWYQTAKVWWITTVAGPDPTRTLENLEAGSRRRHRSQNLIIRETLRVEYLRRSEPKKSSPSPQHIILYIIWISSALRGFTYT